MPAWAPIEAVGDGGEALGVGEAVLVGAHQHAHLGAHVGVGEVDLLLAVVADGDAGHADVGLAVGDRRDHRVPAHVDDLGLEVQPLGDLGHGVVFPADRLAGLGVDELQRRIGVLGRDRHLAAAEVGELGRRRPAASRAKAASEERSHRAWPRRSRSGRRQHAAAPSTGGRPARRRRRAGTGIGRPARPTMRGSAGAALAVFGDDEDQAAGVLGASPDRLRAPRWR